MKMLLFIFLAVLLFAGCQKESISENKAQFDAVSESNQANNTKARPLSGDLNNAPDPDAAPILCSGVLPVSGQNFIFGNVSHLGQLKTGSLATAITYDITNIPSVGDPSFRGTITYNEVWVAANGDKLFMSSTSNVVGDADNDGVTGTFNGSGIITGGTGRFEGATGSWEYVNARYFADGTSAWSISGNITY